MLAKGSPEDKSGKKTGIEYPENSRCTKIWHEAVAKYDSSIVKKI